MLLDNAEISLTAVLFIGPVATAIMTVTDQ